MDGILQLQSSREMITHLAGRMLTILEEPEINHDILNDFNIIVLKFLVDYIHIGQIIITKDEVKVLFHVADFIQVDAAPLLKNLLPPQYCIGANEILSQYQREELLTCFKIHISQHFLEVIKYDEFLSLPFEDLLGLILIDGLNVSEENVFEGVIGWMNVERYCRQQFLYRLLEHERFASFPVEKLSFRVTMKTLLGPVKYKKHIIDAHNNYVKMNRTPCSYDDIPKNY